jgi:hypothetical protein
LAGVFDFDVVRSAVLGSALSHFQGGGDAATESGAAFTYAAARQKQYQT